jgi:N-acyl-D-aspartate/D-glutamate deacylase
MPDFDLLVRGGELLDGTGAPAVRADLGIVGDRIAAIGDLTQRRGAREIDARRKIVAPGFVDVQSQSNLTLLADGNGESHIRQGITTEFIGEGGSPGQMTEKILDQDPRFREWLGSLDLRLDWRGLRGWFERLERSGTSVNVGVLASMDLLRAEAVGLDDRAPTDVELAQMQRIVDESMRDGAFGLAAALVYPPTSYTTTDEIVAVAKIAAKHGGIYATHVRGESGRVFDAVGEAIEIGRRADLPVLVYHLKIAGRPNWGRMRELGDLVAGADRVSACQYPYAAAGTGILAPLPDWSQEGGPIRILERLRDPDTRARIRREMETREAMLGRIDFEIIQLGDRRFTGFDDYFDTIIETRTNAFCIFHSMSEDDVRTAMRFPWLCIASDAEATSPAQQHGHVHPRAFGTFPRVLGRYVREERVLDLPDAIRKMTSLPASRFALEDRGVLRQGAFADVVVFDPDAVTDTATYENPRSYPRGIDDVVVNGVHTIAGGEHTGARAGRALRRPCTVGA